MLPLFPYYGMLRPALVFLAILLLLFVLRITRMARWYRRLQVTLFIVYLVFLVYATFLSRSVSATLSYRLSLLKAARDSFSLEGGLLQMLPRLFQGDFTGISLTNPQSLEGILINILIFIPMGYLLPLLFPKLRRRQVIGIGFLTTVCFEVGQLLTKLGMFDLDDILNNMIGLGIGMILSKKVKPRKVNRK